MLQDPSRVPEVEFAPNEMEKIGAANLNGSTELAEVKVKLVRCLSSLQVETPRDELEAEQMRLKKRVESAQSAGDMASGTDDWV